MDKKMKDRLDSPLHLAAYFLNPYYTYHDSSILIDDVVMDGLLECVETFYHGDVEKQGQVVNIELNTYKRKEGNFAKALAIAGCKDFDFDPGINVYFKHFAPLVSC